MLVKLEKKVRYQKIVENLCTKIRYGELRTGDKIGPIRTLAKEHGVSINPVQRALKILTENKIIRSSDKGFIVSDRAPDFVGRLRTVWDVNELTENSISVINVMYYGTPRLDTPAATWFEMPILNSLQEEALKQNTALTLSFITEENIEKQLDQLKAIGEKLNGIVMTNSQWPNSIIDKLASLKVPLVWTHFCPLWAEKDRDIHQFYIYSDDEASVIDGIKYLINLGHRRIGLLGREGESELDRIQGYRQALADSGIDRMPDLEKIFYFEDPYEHSDAFRGQGFKAMDELMNCSSPPTAVFCTNDMIAFGVIDYIRDAKLTLGVDISVLGYDNLEGEGFVPFNVPLLSSINKPKRAMGRTAVNVLGDHWREPWKKGLDKIALKPELVIRKSCGHNR